MVCSLVFLLQGGHTVGEEVSKCTFLAMPLLLLLVLRPGYLDSMAALATAVCTSASDSSPEPKPWCPTQHERQLLRALATVFLTRVVLQNHRSCCLASGLQVLWPPPAQLALCCTGLLHPQKEAVAALAR